MLCCVIYDNFKDDAESLKQIGKISWFNEVVFVMNPDDCKNHKDIEMDLRNLYRIRHPETTNREFGEVIIRTKEDLCNILSMI